METIKCGECGKDSSLERAESDGVNAARIQRIGWKVKLPVLVGINEWLFACSPNCLEELRARKYAEHNVSQASIAEANRTVERMKAKIPEMTKDVCAEMDKLQKRLNREKKV